MRKTTASLVALLMTASAGGGDATGFVNEISVGNDPNVALFSLSGDNEENPRCNKTEKYALLLSTAGGRAAYQALLEAKRNKYIVQVEGTNVCKFFWQAEDVLSLTIR